MQIFLVFQLNYIIISAYRWINTKYKLREQILRIFDIAFFLYWILEF